MPTVRISEEANVILEDRIEEFKDEHGVEPSKKELLDTAIRNEHGGDNGAE